jgi:PIN domain nuclease of toxin-antitoxin system
MRNLLIDTHILIWWLASPEKIKQGHLDLISNPENTVYVRVLPVSLKFP